MPIDVEGRQIRLRLARLPAHQGFDVVMRILASQGQTRPPDCGVLTKIKRSKKR